MVCDSFLSEISSGLIFNECSICDISDGFMKEHCNNSLVLVYLYLHEGYCLVISKKSVYYKRFSELYFYFLPFNLKGIPDFVNQKLFPYFKKFKVDAENADTIEYKIGEIFSELKNRIQSGYTLREGINLIDRLRFGSNAEKHEMSHLYESKIKNMGNAGRNGGEYYTPRPLIKTIVKVVEPAIGNRIYDGAVGSAGFLCEAFEYLKTSKNLTTIDAENLQKNTFYGKEKKSLAYIIGIMNMIFHGIGSPNIIHTNTLAENITDMSLRQIQQYSSKF